MQIERMDNMADKSPYAGPIAAAKNVALVKAALDKKLDKSGGTITGMLEVTNSLTAHGSIEAENYIKSDLLLMAPTLAINDEAKDATISISVAGDNAAKVTSLGSDGKSRYSRLAVGTPTGDNDAATKAYVDEKAVTVDAALDASSENPVQNKAIKAEIDVKADKTALGSKLDKTGGTITGNLDVSLSFGAGGSISAGVTDTDTGIHFGKATSDAGRISHGGADSTGKPPLARLKVAAPTDDDDAATKQYVDSKASGTGAVRYDAAQGLTAAQQKQARENVDAVGKENPNFAGYVTLTPAGDSAGTGVCLSPSGSGGNYMLNISDVNEGNPTHLTGVATPTDAQTDHAATVEYVKKKVAEIAASGGVDVDNALSTTSENPVQNKVVALALAGKAGTAVATQSANGLMAKADKAKLDGIEAGATKITVDSAMSGSSINPVQNKVMKQYVDDKVAAAGSNITVDATLSSTSTNPVQNKAVKTAIDAKADKSALDAKADVTALDSKADKAALDAKADKSTLDGKMDKSGGTFTGNVYGQYFVGTWLQTTAASDLGRTPGKIAVLDDSGWVYYRTPAELLADLGADYIESQGTTGVWTWRKWHSGIAEMWAVFGATSLAVNNAWGSVYYGTWMNSTANKNGRKYPFAFVDTPVVIATPYSSSTDFWLLTDSQNNLGTPQTYAPAYACVLPGSTTITNPQIHYYVTGKYK